MISGENINIQNKKECLKCFEKKCFPYQRYCAKCWELIIKELYLKDKLPEN